MSEPDPRNFTNSLTPVSLDKQSLAQVLIELQAAITASVELIEQNSSGPWGGKHDNLYSGNSGIALMYLRLSQQLATSQAEKLLKRVAAIHPRPDFSTLATSRLSPIGSSVGPAFVELTRQLIATPVKDEKSEKLWKIAISTLHQAVEMAADFESVEEGSGATEVLYGRAGLLWAILNLRQLLSLVGADPNNKHSKALTPLVDSHVICELVNKLINVGKSGKVKFESQYGVKGLPLMWEWHGKYYLGAIHGTAGILTIILQAPTDIVLPHMPVILATIQGLVQLASSRSGHLPSSLPVKSHNYHLVQICHGSPGLLLLLSTIKSCFPEHWDEELYARDMNTAAEKVWEEGLVKKGLGVCHGVAGNAWPLLLLGNDINLSRGLAFLLHATQLPPLSRSADYPYRTPDHPWSLFEGLAGAVCAWADACVIIEARLQTLTKARVFGVPGLGGLGAIGMF